MVRALVSARTAGRRARLEERPERCVLGRRLPRRDPCGGGAHVGAVEAEPDAARLVGDVGLGEARVGAGRAGRRAVHALVDAADEELAIDGCGSWMRSEELADAHAPSVTDAPSPRIRARFSGAK
jgi:hypothetical protein